jgi:fatty acid omega-hydroxylase
MILLLLFVLSLIFIFFKFKKPSPDHAYLPRSYPIVGTYFSLKANAHRRVQYTSDILVKSPTGTVTFPFWMGRKQILTADPATVKHILKTNFHNYEKGPTFRETMFDFLGNGIFGADGEKWKFQRQVASHEFNTRSLRKFVEQVVDSEINDRLIPLLSDAAEKNKVIDLQDVLQRFAFDNICKIAFGYDPEYLTRSLPQSDFAEAFDDATVKTSERFRSFIKGIWKIKRLLGVGSEKKLKESVSEVREFAKKIVREKKLELEQNSSLDSVDLLSRFLTSGHADEDFVTDIVISFIIAGRDTTSAALTWFFWLLDKNLNVENLILNELTELTAQNSDLSMFEEAKDMVYTHAAVSEAIRLYPPVPVDSKVAMIDDVLPDGTPVKKGTPVTYHPYAMGRMKSIWGSDVDEFKPERWLERDGSEEGKWNFVSRDPYTFTAFQAGPRICLGKEMAYLQMKRVVAGILRQFKVVSALPEGVEPVFVVNMTGKMKGGFPVRIEERNTVE